MSESKYRVIAIDDEVNILLSIESCLSSDDYYIETFNNASDAFIAMQRHLYDCAIIDIRLGSSSGLDLFKKMLASKITIPAIFMSGNASLKEAAESQKLGAYDFLEKPFSSEKLKISVDNCLNFYRLRNRLQLLEKRHYHHDLIGEHPLMKQLKVEVSKVSQTTAAVLIQGESGTGKELIATAIHQASARADRSLVTVNCSAIPETLVESALFGHNKGAFTGADESHKGYFEQANKSTIFLDEIGDMPLAAQASLLRVLENQDVQKLGSSEVIKVDVRVIAATHKDLKKAIKNGHFRQDLYYRISVIPITSPALRDRLSDLSLLVEHLLQRLCLRHGLPIKKFTSDCLSWFEKYSWPGNVRELANTLERMIIMGGDTLDRGDIPKDITFNSPLLSNDLSLKAFRAATERELIVNRLKRFNGNITQVALSLDIDRTNLHKKIKLYEISRNSGFE